MREIIIHCWDELMHDIFEGVWDEKIMRYRANRVYRGASDREWGLVPSLNRVCSHDLTLESSIIRSFRKYGYADLVNYDSIWQILPLAQHHGLPTRLLDWTYSPLVACACQSSCSSCQTLVTFSPKLKRTPLSAA